MSEFKEKSAKEVWLGDSKVRLFSILKYGEPQVFECSEILYSYLQQHYLHAGLIVLIITLPIVASTYMFETTPDSGRTKTLLISDEDIECDPAVIHGTEGEKKASAAAEVTARREQ